MQAKILNLYKPIGITPFQLIEKLKQKYPEYQNQKLGYAGRLDPMAEGVLLILVGEENKKRKEYERLKKEYEFDVLFGVKTDSYDILGKIVKYRHSREGRLQNQKRNGFWTGQNDEDKIRDFIKKHTGKHLQEYPPYSSPRVNGKPLFWWARSGRLSEIEIPKKEIEIYDFKIIKTYELKSKELEKIINEKISKVKGTFRQKDILTGWKQFFRNYCSCHLGKSEQSGDASRINEITDSGQGTSNVPSQNDDTSFRIFRFSISCSSGTYVRSIANEMGGIALNIKRTRVGNYVINESIK